MSKFSVIVCDPPWAFSDKLRQNAVKRGAADQYGVLKDSDIVNLPVLDIVADDAVLALWVPSSKMEVGLRAMASWGFKQKQTWVWVKVKANPFKHVFREIKSNISCDGDTTEGRRTDLNIIQNCLMSVNLNDSLAFGMGRTFRQTHEICLIGTRGKINSKLKNRSQRSVYFWPITKHSEKPDGLQDMLDKMFDGRKLEMFARRVRPEWECVGLECPSSGEDIKESLKRLRL